MSRPIVHIGVPTALGGHQSGMERTPDAMRQRGLLERLDGTIHDAGDVVIEPGFRPDPDRRARNRDLIAEFMPREAALVATALGSGGREARLMIVGGDCTAHAGALAGIRRARPDTRLAIAWFDAHGDFNTPATTPSGNVWGMPFAMICGRGDQDLVGACDGPTVDPRHAALIGGQVLDEQESRMLVTAGVAHFGSGMLATEAGMAALAAWAQQQASEVDGLYIAVDFDVLDASGGWAVQMPEPNGLSLQTAVRAVDTLSRQMPVVGFGATGLNHENGDAPRTVEAVAQLCGAALG